MSAGEGTIDVTNPDLVLEVLGAIKAQSPGFEKKFSLYLLRGVTGALKILLSSRDAEIATLTASLAEARERLAVMQPLVDLVLLADCCDGDDARRTVRCCEAIADYKAALAAKGAT